MWMHMRAIRQDLFHGQAICIKERDRYVATTQEILNGLASLQESHPTHKLDVVTAIKCLSFVFIYSSTIIPLVGTN